MYLISLAGHSRSLAGLPRFSSALCLVLAEEVLANDVKLLDAAQVGMHAMICNQSRESFLVA